MLRGYVGSDLPKFNPLTRQIQCPFTGEMLAAVPAPRPDVLPLSIGDGELAETADTAVSVPEIFRYWLQGGRVDVGFLGAAQLDRFGNINTTVIGDYRAPKVRLPGAGGAPEIAASAGEVFIILRQHPRAMVATLDFVTSVGYLDGGRDARRKAGLPARGRRV